MLKKLTYLLTVVGYFLFCCNCATAAEQGGLAIRGFLNSGNEANLVSIEGGYQSGVKAGEVFRAVRPSRAGISFPVETGLLKVVAVHEFDSVAEIIRQGTTESLALFGDFGGVMAGDLALAQKINIAPAKILAPEITLKFSRIFDDPRAEPATYELTMAGRNELRHVAERMAGIRAGMLIIEGHTDAKGSSEQNQMESYQRALTVRQIFIDEFGFDESRITALGLGESQPVSDALEPSNTDKARRIVFKVIPNSSAM